MFICVLFSFGESRFQSVLESRNQNLLTFAKKTKPFAQSPRSLVHIFLNFLKTYLTESFTKKNRGKNRKKTWTIVMANMGFQGFPPR